jgi:hypothetical protein
MTNEQIKEWLYDNFEFVLKSKSSFIVNLIPKTEIGEWLTTQYSNITDHTMYLYFLGGEVEIFAWPIYTHLKQFHNLMSSRHLEIVITSLYWECRNNYKK